MKKVILSICCVSIFSIFSVQAVMQNKGVDKKANEKNKIVNAKCHVALVDGSEAIIFYRLQSEHFSKLTKKIVGKKVLTQESIKKIKVYKAYECVLEQDSFTKASTQSLDKKTER